MNKLCDMSITVSYVIYEHVIDVYTCTVNACIVYIWKYSIMIYLLWLIEKWYHTWCDGWNSYFIYMVVHMLWLYGVILVYVCVVFTHGQGNVNGVWGCVITFIGGGEHDWFHS